MLSGVSSFRSAAAIGNHQRLKNHAKFSWDPNKVFHHVTALKMSKSMQGFRAVARRMLGIT
jgi:hypothetical protein